MGCLLEASAEYPSARFAQKMGERLELVYVVVSGSVSLYGAGIIVTLSSFFFVGVSWFPTKSNIHPIVQRMMINGRRRRMSVRLRIWVQPVMVGCARVGVIAFMNFGYGLVLRLG